MNFAQPLSDDTLVRAAVRVVLPWSMWPMVPTLTCGLLRSNFSLAMSSAPSSLSASTFAGRATVNNLRCRGLPTEARCVLASEGGADVQDRTGDLVLTKDALCQLSYIGVRLRLRPIRRPCLRTAADSIGGPCIVARRAKDVRLSARGDSARHRAGSARHALRAVADGAGDGDRTR